MDFAGGRQPRGPGYALGGEVAGVDMSHDGPAGLLQHDDEAAGGFAPRDNIHGLLAALLGSAQHSIVVNMFGYDDDELNKIIQSKLANENVYVQMSLDRSQASGAHEKQILASWNNNAFGNSIAIGTSSVHNAISHLKIVIVDGV